MLENLPSRGIILLNEAIEKCPMTVVSNRPKFDRGNPTCVGVLLLKVFMNKEQFTTQPM